ncbi:MAG: hypothetical protein APF84_05710 [Gracilibacter sp. BRH_c7a]|nr:MAG: hypothetical protein APF84_05710 [Gracilibacter sp. BRH_c7a]
MINKKVLISAGLSLLMVVGAIAVSGSSVYAEETENNLSAKFRGINAGFMSLKEGAHKPAFQEKIKIQLAELVSNGTLTQTEADKVVEYYRNYTKPNSTDEKIKPIDQIVKDGVLTQAKADAIVTILSAKHLRSKGEIHREKNNLADLVSDGTLSQTEADKIKEYLKEYRSRKDITSGEKMSPIEQMVKDGVITQEKADEIFSFMKQKI